jgi:hypothetical protein
LAVVSVIVAPIMTLVIPAATVAVTVAVPVVVVFVLPVAIAVSTIVRRAAPTSPTTSATATVPIITVVISVSVAGAPTTSCRPLDRREKKMRPEGARRIFQPCLHRLIARDVAKLDCHLRAAKGIGLDVGRRDLGAVRWIHELEDDHGAWERPARAVQELDDERIPDWITGHSGLTIAGYHSKLRRNVGAVGNQQAVAGTGCQHGQEQGPNRSVGGESVEGK